jgi:integrase
MRGHLTERRPGVWRIVISNGFDDSGKRRQIVRTVNGSKRSAERELTKMLREFDRGTLAEGRQPLRVYLESDWLPSVSGTSKRGRPLAPTTRARYADAVDHISRHIGAVRLDELRSTHVERLRDRLLAEGRLGPQTIADVLRVLAQALSRAEAKTLVGKNWADPRLVNRPVGASGDFVVIDATLAGTILEAVRGYDPWDVAAHLGLGLGLRREEVLGLRWSDVDESVGPDKSGVVRVRQTLTYAAGEYHFGPPKSQAGERDIQLPDFVERSLRRHRAAQGKRLLAIGMVSELVVDDGMGGPWMPASFSTGWRRFAKRNGFDRITFHTLRHGAATLLLAAGVSDAVAINIMGHADTKILGRYQDVVGELKRDAAARLDSVFGGGGGI